MLKKKMTFSYTDLEEAFSDLLLELSSDNMKKRYDEDWDLRDINFKMTTREMLKPCVLVTVTLEKIEQS